jgi:hypothetical protein
VSVTRVVTAAVQGRNDKRLASCQHLDGGGAITAVT